jgi:hypothetical protein
MINIGSDSNPRRIVAQLDEDGVVCLTDVVPSDWLARTRAAVVDHLRDHGEHDHFIRSPHLQIDSPTADFINSPSVRALLDGIVKTRFPDGSADAELVGAALRIIAGPKGEGDAWWFHYDASVVTMIVPLFIPDAGRGNSGELVGFFNRRPFRRFVISNIVGKAVSQSAFYRRRILRRLDTPDFGRIVDMQVGNLYLLWGYRSLHANMPCQAGALRATLLLHFGRPHGRSKTLHNARRVHKAIRDARHTPEGSAAVRSGF